MIAYYSEFKMAVHVHYFAYDDPARQVANERADEVSRVLDYAVYLPWLAFTACHVGLRVRRKFLRSTKV